MDGVSMKRRAGVAVVAGLLGAVAVWCSLPGSLAGAAPISIDAACSATGTLTEKGNALISSPLKAELASTPVAISFPGDATATANVGPGGTITYKVVLTIDLQALATDTLTTAVKPAIHDGAVGTGFSEQQATALANTAALNLRLIGLTGTLPVPKLTHIVGAPTATVSAGGPSVSVIAGANGVTYALGAVVANARQAQSVSTTTIAGTPSFTLTLGFKAQADQADDGDIVSLHPGPLAFSFAGAGTAGGLNVSINLDGAEIAGGVNGAERCTPSDIVLATTGIGQGAGGGPTTTRPGATTTTTATAPTGPSPARAAAIRTYAPSLYFAASEALFPTTVDFFLKHACLKYHYVQLVGTKRVQRNGPVAIGVKPACGDLLAANASRLGSSPADPLAHRTVRDNAFTGPSVLARELTRPLMAGRSTKLTEPAEGFVLDETSTAFAGPSTWATTSPAYVTTGNLPGGNWYARYFFFYGANTKTFDPHEGDWESVAIKFSASGTPTRIAYWQHACAPDADHKGLDVPWRATALDAGTHPKVFVSPGSHTNYRWPATGTPATTNLVCGHPEMREPTSAGGKVFRPWSATGAGTPSIEGAPWYGFGGAWGAYDDTEGGSTSVLLGAILTGPVGPSPWLAGPPPAWR